MSNTNNVIRKQPKHNFPKKKILCLVSNPATLHGMKVGFFAEEMTSAIILSSFKVLI